MITANDCLKRYGDPNKQSSMIVWDIPAELEQGVIPHKLYCNKDLRAPLQAALQNVIKRGLIIQIKTWDGCFNIRAKRGNPNSYSLHAWGVAIDINAATNGFGETPTMSKELVQCFKDAGFDWGGNWSKPDGMHFQLAKFP